MTTRNAERLQNEALRVALRLLKEGDDAMKLRVLRIVFAKPIGRPRLTVPAPETPGEALSPEAPVVAFLREARGQ